jgi:hypothetical protein
MQPLKPLAEPTSCSRQAAAHGAAGPRPQGFSRLCVDLILANGRGRELDDGITPPCWGLKCLPSTSNLFAKTEAGHEQAHEDSAREAGSIGLSLVSASICRYAVTMKLLHLKV